MTNLYPSASSQIDKSEHLPCYIEPTLTHRDNFWLSDEFRNRVIVHILRNFISESLDFPLMLAIQGGAGDGKSSQVREVCSRNGIYIFPISGALLSGSHERQAVKELFNIYIAASKFRAERNRCVCILIDDFDLSVASTFGDRSYTVNSQLLTGSLMNLADDPKRCGTTATQRVPIIITGNNFTALHAPLIRHGRMDFYNWHPTREDKLQIIHRIYDGFLSTKEFNNLEKLLNSFSDQSISFFTSLKNDLINQIILSHYLERKEGSTIQHFEYLIKEITYSCTVDDLLELGNKRLISQPKNYVSKIQDAFLIAEN